METEPARHDWVHPRQTIGTLLPGKGVWVRDGSRTHRGMIPLQPTIPFAISFETLLDISVKGPSSHHRYHMPHTYTCHHPLGLPDDRSVEPHEGILWGAPAWIMTLSPLFREPTSWPLRTCFGLTGCSCGFNPLDRGWSSTNAILMKMWKSVCPRPSPRVPRRLVSSRRKAVAPRALNYTPPRDDPRLHSTEPSMAVGRKPSCCPSGLYDRSGSLTAVLSGRLVFRLEDPTRRPRGPGLPVFLGPVRSFFRITGRAYFGYRCQPVLFTDHLCCLV